MRTLCLDYLRSLTFRRREAYWMVLMVRNLVYRKFTLLDVHLPKKLGANATLNLVLETIQIHMTEPWPEYAGQKDEQAMRYTNDLFVLSPYPTSIQRTKIKFVSSLHVCCKY